MDQPDKLRCIGFQGEVVDRGNRVKVIYLLEYFKTLGAPANMAHWRVDAEAAGLLAGAVRNDHI